MNCVTKLDPKRPQNKMLGLSGQSARFRPIHPGPGFIITAPAPAHREFPGVYPRCTPRKVLKVAANGATALAVPLLRSMNAPPQASSERFPFRVTALACVAALNNVAFGTRHLHARA